MFAAPEAGTSACSVGPKDLVHRLTSLESRVAELVGLRKEGEDAAAALQELTRRLQAEEERLIEVVALTGKLAAKDEEIHALEESGKEEAHASAEAEEAWAGKVAAVEVELARSTEELAAANESVRHAEARADVYMAKTVEMVVQKTCVDLALEAAVTCMHALACSPRRIVREKMQLERDLEKSKARVAELEEHLQKPRELSVEEAKARFHQPDMVEFRERVSVSAGEVATRMIRKLVELGHDPVRIANTPFSRLKDMYQAARGLRDHLATNGTRNPLALALKPPSPPRQFPPPSA